MTPPFRDLERAIANIGKKKPSLILVSIGNDKLGYYESQFEVVRAPHPQVKFAVVSNNNPPLRPGSAIDRVFNRNDKNAIHHLFDYIGSV